MLREQLNSIDLIMGDDEATAVEEAFDFLKNFNLKEKDVEQLDFDFEDGNGNTSGRQNSESDPSTTSESDQSGSGEMDDSDESLSSLKKSFVTGLDDGGFGANSLEAALLGLRDLGS
eukprot:TRINITY_DN6004_c0_g1_i8.p2 TRINITY_DN6004_c0_g1~~TRINITY_DN6004_c0_g1_i8.p2  ORF type:complete len:117 (-),score=40.11 TRINITY_DN6004_c0_g1_i8:153-503(-)